MSEDRMRQVIADLEVEIEKTSVMVSIDQYVFPDHKSIHSYALHRLQERSDYWRTQLLNLSLHPETYTEEEYA